MSEPKVLFFDLETSPMEVVVFSLFKPIISINQIRKHSRIMCWSAMWQGSKRVLFDSEYHSDYRTMLQGIRDLVDEADIVVGYNSDNFDIKWLNEQFLENGIELPSPYRKIDLYKLNKGNLYFPSGKLDYMAQRLLEESKVTHSGMDMWIACMNPDHPNHAKAWAQMKKYAIQDTRLLPDLFEKMRPFIKINFEMYREGDEQYCCTDCGSPNVQKRGFHYTNAGKYQRYACTDCGSWSYDPKRIDTTALRTLSA